MFNCEFCNKEFSSLSSLNNHKKTAKYCLKIQENENLNIDKKDFNCEFCHKILTSKFNIQKHLLICNMKIIKEKEDVMNNIIKEKDDIIKEKDDIIKEKDNQINNIIKEKDEIIENKNKEILDLIKEVSRLSGKNEVYLVEQNSLLKIAEQPKNTSNTTNNSVTNLAVYDPKVIEDRFLSRIENIKPEDIYDGQASIARIVAPCLVNDDGSKMVTCTDKSRGVFAIKDKDGNISKDNVGEELVKVIEPIATKKAEEILNLDTQKRSKSINLRLYKNKIKQLEEELKEYESTLRGQVEGTSGWKQTRYQIENNNNQIQKYYQKIEEIETEGIPEAPKDYEYVDDKLETGVIQIKEMKTDSKKFQNNLSKI